MSRSGDRHSTGHFRVRFKQRFGFWPANGILREIVSYIQEGLAFKIDGYDDRWVVPVTLKDRHVFVTVIYRDRKLQTIFETKKKIQCGFFKEMSRNGIFSETEEEACES